MLDGTSNADSHAWRAEQPHNGLPPLPPRGEIETKAVLKKCVAARAALSGLNQATALIPDQSIPHRLAESIDVKVYLRQADGSFLTQTVHFDADVTWLASDRIVSRQRSAP